MTALNVYLHANLAGTLERQSRARLRFAYTGEWVEAERQPLSLSLPVRTEPFDHDECAPFFEGLLPEGDFLRAIARTLHVSARNPFQLLSEIGGECAGAISVGPAGGPVPGRSSAPPRWLNEPELAELLSQLPKRPLLAAIDESEEGDGVRLSLAGAQDKVGVLADDGRIGLSRGMPPTARTNICSSTATTATALCGPTAASIRRTCARHWGWCPRSSTRRREGRESTIVRA